MLLREYELGRFSDTPIAPALDLEEFFEKRIWERNERPSTHQNLVLNQGLYFLELALGGQQIAISTLEEGKLGVDLAAIKAYLLSAKAISKSRLLRKSKVDRILTIVHLTLFHLAKEEWVKDRLTDEDTNIAREFFSSLSQVLLEQF